MITHENVVDELNRRIPEFKEVYNEHLNDNYGEVLHHPLFADLTRFTIAVYRSSVEAGGDSLQSSNTFDRILGFIEDAAQSGDEGVAELVQLSFLENLHQTGPYYWAIRSRLKPVSFKLLESVEQGWNGSTK